MDSRTSMEGLKQRFSYQTWSRRTGAAATARVEGFALAPPSSWRFEQRRAIPGGGFVDYFAGETDPSRRVMVLIFEHRDHEQALLRMLLALGGCMAPTLTPLSECNLSIGDVGFAGFAKETNALQYVRCNVFVDVRSIGRVSVSVVDIARHIDVQIQSAVVPSA